MLWQRAIGVGECLLNLAAERTDDGDGDGGDQRDHNAVLNHGGAFFTLPEVLAKRGQLLHRNNSQVSRK